jgi:hypothetical protein
MNGNGKNLEMGLRWSIDLFVTHKIDPLPAQGLIRERQGRKVRGVGARKQHPPCAHVNLSLVQGGRIQNTETLPFQRYAKMFGISK